MRARDHTAGVYARRRLPIYIYILLHILILYTVLYRYTCLPRFSVFVSINPSPNVRDVITCQGV